MRFISITRFLILVLFFSTLSVPGIGQPVVRIMPLGNSITRGEETDGGLLESQMKGYRYDLKVLLEAAGYMVDFVGSESAGYLYFDDSQHAGIGGSRDQYVARLLTDGYDERWDRQTIEPPGPYLDVFNPDIILLHIGTNDITHESETELYDDEKVSTILNLVDQYEARAQKEVIVFLALIINRRNCVTGCYTTTQWNIFINNLALNRIAGGDKIVIVDMENDAGFLYTDVDMADDLHPNSLGYSKMASLWASSIMANYNTKPAITEIPDQIFDEGGSSDVINLDDFVSDLEDPDEQISWTASQVGSQNLNITIDDNRQATATPVNISWNGTQTVVFTATDQGRNGKYIKSSTDTVIFTVTPVDNLTDISKTSSNIHVYPNPSYDQIILDIKDRSGDLDFMLFDITGKPVLKKTICKTCEAQINLNQYAVPPGLYFYKIYQSSEIFTGKLLVNKK
jgi:lysophospholipase L1-like esterase